MWIISTKAEERLKKRWLKTLAYLYAGGAFNQLNALFVELLSFKFSCIIKCVKYFYKNYHGLKNKSH